MTKEFNWPQQIKNLCLHPQVTNLNAGSCSPTTHTVLAATLELSREQAGDPVNFSLRQGAHRLDTVRQVLAQDLSCDPDRLLLLTNASYGVNTVFRSILSLSAPNSDGIWRPGDEVLTTDQEYIHYQPLLRRLGADHGLTVRRVSLPLGDTHANATAADIIAAFKQALGPRTRLIFLSHVTAATGTQLPVAALCQLARSHGVLSFVDGAHGPGLVDVHLGEHGSSNLAIDCDFYAANIHKWLMGSTGSGFLYVRPEHRGSLVPLITTAYSEVNWEHANAPSLWQLSHEYQGTRNIIPLLVAPYALAFRRSLPEDALRHRTRCLAAQCRDMLAALGYTPVSPWHEDLATCMQAFKLPAGARNIDSTVAWHTLRAQHQLEVALPALLTGESLLRVSCAWFNQSEDLEYLVRVLKKWSW